MLRADGQLCKEEVIDSGSAELDVLAALSGDVTMPRSRDPQGRLVLIDRYPHAVISFVSPQSPSLVEQISVGTGFPANPHDIYFLEDGRAYVSRFATNGAAEGSQSLNAGGDVLIVDMEAMSIAGRIPLSSDEGYDPMPSRMAELDGLVWVALSHLARDFGSAGPGRVVGLDPATDTVSTSLTLEGLSNCGAMVRDMDNDSLWLACSGLFALGEQAQREASALVHLELIDGSLQEGWRLSASEHIKSAVAFSIEPLAPKRVAFTAFGSFEADTPDRLLLADASMETLWETGVEGSAYELGALLFSSDEGLLLLADAAPSKPLIRRFEVKGESLIELEPVVGSPATGLPPRGLIRFR